LDQASNVIALKDRSRQRLLEALYREHAPALKGFLRLRRVADADRDDLMQEVFLRLARIDDLPVVASKDSGSTRAYLFTIANRLILDQWRHTAMSRRHGLTEVEELPEAPGGHTPDRWYPAEQELDRVEKAIGQMNDRWRTAFVLSRFRNLTHREIAAAMGVTPKRVEKYVASALGVLRRHRTT
jgi:RNA polymerase sigma-70 factor (ECF subfamily)